MDLFRSNFLTVLLLLVVAGLAIIKFKLPSIVGAFGEWLVNRKLLNLRPDKYQLLADLLLPSHGNTETTQIDHVVVSNFGIFCIETKTLKGWIFGNARQKQWTQVIYRYKKKFYNPLRQNYAHTKAVEALIYPEFSHVPIKGFVAFPVADKLRISGTDTVGTARQIVNKIEQFQTEILSDIERDKIVQILNEANILDEEIRKSHKKQIRSLKRGW